MTLDLACAKKQAHELFPLSLVAKGADRQETSTGAARQEYCQLSLRNQRTKLDERARNASRNQELSIAWGAKLVVDR